MVTGAEDRAVRVVEANFRSQEQVGEDIVFGEWLDGHAHGGLVVVGTDGRAGGEAIGGVFIPFQAGVQCEARIKRVADVASRAAPLLDTTR